VEAQIVNGVLTQGIKLAVNRTRPSGGSYSFPSGHTSATFATAGVLQREFGWKVGIPAYVGGFYVAASRLAERQHYLSDVVFGAAIGLASSQTIAIHTRYGVVSAYPALMKGGAALVFTVH
jgi:membrane-associated phospholipid phosphatase